MDAVCSPAARLGVTLFSQEDHKELTFCRKKKKILKMAERRTIFRFAIDTEHVAFLGGIKTLAFKFSSRLSGSERLCSFAVPLAQSPLSTKWADLVLLPCKQ